MITTELDFVYIYNGKKFLTEKEALKYKKFLKNELELVEEYQNDLETPIGVGFAQKDYK